MSISNLFRIWKRITTLLGLSNPSSKALPFLTRPPQLFAKEGLIMSSNPPNPKTHPYAQDYTPRSNLQIDMYDAH